MALAGQGCPQDQFVVRVSTRPVILFCSPMTISTVRHIYWVNQFTNMIGRADLDGQNANQSFITGASSPAAVAVDAGHVYWVNAGTGTIGRADLDGQNANQSFITGASNARRGGGRRRPRLLDQRRHGHDRPRRPGRAERQPELHHRRLHTADGVAVDAGHVYWTNLGTGTIGRADLDGQNANQSFITGASAPPRGRGRRRPRLLDQRQHGHDRPGRPRRAEREPELHHRRAPIPIGVTVDAGHVYWTNRQQRRARSAAPTSTGRTRTRASSAARAFRLRSRSIPSESGSLRSQVAIGPHGTPRVEFCRHDGTLLHDYAASAV